MGTLEVVPSQPTQQFEVEVGEVVEEEQVVVIVDAFLLDGAIEAFAVGVHFRGLGEGMPVSEQSVGESGREIALEFAAVVGEHRFDGEGEHRLNQAKELCGGGAGMTARGPGPGEVRMQIGAGDDVAAIALRPQFDAVQGHTMARTLGVEMLGLAQAWPAYRLGFAVGAQPTRPGAHLVRCVSDQAADSTGARTGQLVGRGKHSQQQVQLLFRQIRVQRAQASNLGDQHRWPLTPVPALGRGRTRHQGREVAAFRPQFGPPQIEGAAADPEGFAGGRYTIALPEPQNLPSALGIGGNHAPA